MKMRPALALACLVTLLPELAAAQTESRPDGALLAYQFRTGRSMRFAVSSELMAATTRKGDQQESRTTQSQLSVIRIDVKDFNSAAKLASLTYTTESLRMTMTDSAGNSTVIDSNDPESLANSPEAALISAMIDLPIEMVVNVRGSPIAVNGDPVREQVVERLGDPSVRPMIDAALSDQVLTSLFGMTLRRLPGQILSLGGTWSSRYVEPIPMLGQIPYAVDSTLVDVDEEDGRILATLESHITLQADPARMLMGMRGWQDVEVLQSDGKATTSFDASGGMVVSSSLTTEFSISYVEPDPRGGGVQTTTTIVNGQEVRRIVAK